MPIKFDTFSPRRSFNVACCGVLRPVGLFFGRQLRSSEGDHRFAGGKSPFSLIPGIGLIGDPAGKPIGISCGNIVLIKDGELLLQCMVNVKRLGELDKRVTWNGTSSEPAIIDGL